MGVTTELIPRILRDMNDGVLALDKSGRIIYMNPQSRELFQLTEEAIGKTYAEVFLESITEKKTMLFIRWFWMQSIEKKRPITEQQFL